MKISAGVSLLLIIFLVSISFLGGTGCANQIPPTGGPRDSIPPLLVSVTPPDSALGFSGKKITLVFNEYVQLQDIRTNVVVSPTPKIEPDIQSRLRSITITLKDTLEENTTYAINFGKAIRDITESNALEEFTYIFSTGPALDSLELTGIVVNAETGKLDSTLIVMLHRNLADSAIVNERPRYITKVEGDGSFTFRYLPSDTFALYAIKDEGSSRRYQMATQLLAFHDRPINTGQENSPITLYAYLEKSEPKPTSSLARPVGLRGATNTQDKRLRMELNLLDGQLDLLSPLEINFPQAPLKTFDSSKIRFTGELYEPLTGYGIARDTSDKKITVSYPWRENTVYNVIVDKDFAEDTAGRKLLKDDTLTFRTKKESQYGSVRLRFSNVDLTKNPVLLFVQNDAVKYTYPFSTNEFNARLFTPGDYELRILLDENRNGKWDPGEFFGKHRQPEKVLPIRRKLTVRANFDNEVDIVM